MYSDIGEINDIYPDAIREVMSRGAEVTPRGKITKELHPVLLEITNPRRRLVTSFARPINVAFALAEAIWILGGRRDVAMLAAYNSTIEQFSDDGEKFNAAYGYRLRTDHGHDQLMDVIATLRKDPDSRQAVLLMWKPDRDKGFQNARVAYEETHPIGWTPTADEAIYGLADGSMAHETKDRACNVLAHLLVRDGALDWTQVIRSNDALWGTPYNWMQWTHLQEYVAAQVGVPVGSFFHFANSFHIYETHFNETAFIEGYDLYDKLQFEHKPCGNIGIDDINVLMREEYLMRITPDPANIVLHVQELDEYWLGVMMLLNAHHLYKAGQDVLALNMLTQVAGLDPVYALAQIRFYYYWRWHKPEYEKIERMLTTWIAGEYPGAADSLSSWVTDAPTRSW